jgi:hypothetical protein
MSSLLHEIVQSIEIMLNKTLVEVYSLPYSTITNMLKKKTNNVAEKREIGLEPSLSPAYPKRKNQERELCTFMHN